MGKIHIHKSDHFPPKLPSAGLERPPLCRQKSKPTPIEPREKSHSPDSFPFDRHRMMLKKAACVFKKRRVGARQGKVIVGAAVKPDVLVEVIFWLL